MCAYWEVEFVPVRVYAYRYYWTPARRERTVWPRNVGRLYLKLLLDRPRTTLRVRIYIYYVYIYIYMWAVRVYFNANSRRWNWRAGRRVRARIYKSSVMMARRAEVRSYFFVGLFLFPSTYLRSPLPVSPALTASQTTIHRHLLPAATSIYHPRPIHTRGTMTTTNGLVSRFTKLCLLLRRRDKAGSVAHFNGI